MILLSFIFFGYIVIVFGFCILWQLYLIDNVDPLPVEGISVVIPFRNEKDSLNMLLISCEELLEETQKEHDIEFVFINDHSTDEGEEDMLKHSLFQKENVKLINLKETKGKKAAIKIGIQESKYDWIWQIDADTSFKKYTLLTMIRLLSYKVKMILGPVDVIEKPNELEGKQVEKPYFLEAYQQIENVLLQWVTGVTAMINKPVLANGANLLYEKKAFLNYQENKLGEEFESGDDMFLMNDIKLNYGGSAIRYCKHPDAVVKTFSKDTWDELYDQKSRWLGKMASDKLKVSWILKFVFFIVFLIPYLLIFSFLISYISIKGLIGLLLFKAVFEMFCFSIIQSLFKKEKISLRFPFFMILYPFSLIKILKYAKTHNVNWKGRPLK